MILGRLRKLAKQLDALAPAKELNRECAVSPDQILSDNIGYRGQFYSSSGR